MEAGKNQWKLMKLKKQMTQSVYNFIFLFILVHKEANTSTKSTSCTLASTDAGKNKGHMISNEAVGGGGGGIGEKNISENMAVGQVESEQVDNEPGNKPQDIEKSDDKTRPNKKEDEGKKGKDGIENKELSQDNTEDEEKEKEKQEQEKKEKEEQEKKEKEEQEKKEKEGQEKEKEEQEKKEKEGQEKKEKEEQEKKEKEGQEKKEEEQEKEEVEEKEENEEEEEATGK